MNAIRIGMICAMSLALGFTGCESSRPMPTTPSVVVNPPPPLPTPLPAPRAVYTPNITLSGVVSEETPSGLVPLAGVRVYCEPCTEETHSDAETDAKGLYSFKGVWEMNFSIRVTKEGYKDPEHMVPNTGFPRGPGWRDVKMNGDTRFDTQLARR